MKAVAPVYPLRKDLNAKMVQRTSCGYARSTTWGGGSGDGSDDGSDDGDQSGEHGAK